MSESEKQTALVPAQPTALTIAGVKSLVARGSADLRVKEEAEEWLKKGMDFRQKLRYKDAFACFERGIQLNPNHPEIQFMLGFMYSNGHGISQDHVQAAIWYRKAGERGHAAAQYNLGCYYRDGQGVSRDYAQAMVWFRRAIDQNSTDAQTSLGSLYYHGQGVTQDYVQALDWFHRAAEQNNAAAQYNLGNSYLRGQGVPQNYAESYFWLDLAASGLKGSEQTYAITCRDEATSHLTSAELSLARERVNKWVDDHIDEEPYPDAGFIPHERVNKRLDDHADISAGFRPISGAIELDPDEVEDYPPNALGSREEVSN
jgi:tetratricopeptide (TPR) repeat protein